MCFNPDLEVKPYFTFINQNGGDLRALYYIQSRGDLSFVVRGKQQNNKIILEDKIWDRKSIYNVKSPFYKSGMLKSFKDKMKEGKK